MVSTHGRYGDGFHIVDGGGTPEQTDVGGKRRLQPRLALGGNIAKFKYGYELKKKNLIILHFTFTEIVVTDPSSMIVFHSTFDFVERLKAGR